MTSVERIKATFKGEKLDQVDILCFYEDLEYQNALQINPETFRKYYKPYY